MFYGGSNTLASTSASGGEVVQATERNIALFDENHFTPAFLPDGKWAAFTRAGDAFQDVWIADLGRGGISRFTFEGGRSPVWSPDGSQLAFLRQDSILSQAGHRRRR